MEVDFLAPLPPFLFPTLPPPDAEESLADATDASASVPDAFADILEVVAFPASAIR